MTIKWGSTCTKKGRKLTTHELSCTQPLQTTEGSCTSTTSSLNSCLASRRTWSNFTLATELVALHDADVIRSAKASVRPRTVSHDSTASSCTETSKVLRAMNRRSLW